MKSENEKMPRLSEILLAIIKISEENKETWSVEELCNAIASTLDNFKSLSQRKTAG